MAKILFGTDSDGSFKSYEIIRASIKSTDRDGAAVEIVEKIDDLMDRISQKDHVRAELIRACPAMQIVNGDEVVAALLDNPVYEHGSVDIAAVDSVSEEKPQRRVRSAPKTGSISRKKARSAVQKTVQKRKTKPAGTKKDVARSIFKKMKNKQRKDVIQAMIDELGITKAHASTYYQSIKKEQ